MTRRAVWLGRAKGSGHGAGSIRGLGVNVGPVRRSLPGRWPGTRFPALLILTAVEPALCATPSLDKNPVSGAGVNVGVAELLVELDASAGLLDVYVVTAPQAWSLNSLGRLDQLLTGQSGPRRHWQGCTKRKQCNSGQSWDSIHHRDLPLSFATDRTALVQSEQRMLPGISTREANFVGSPGSQR